MHRGQSTECTSMGWLLIPEWVLEVPLCNKTTGRVYVGFGVATSKAALLPTLWLKHRILLEEGCFRGKLLAGSRSHRWVARVTLLNGQSSNRLKSYFTVKCVTLCLSVVRDFKKERGEEMLSHQLLIQMQSYYRGQRLHQQFVGRFWWRTVTMDF